MTEASRRLQAAREQAGLTIEELSARTRIKVTFLRAIERGEFEQLPGEFFTRAFLRTYAREVRLAPDEIVAEYDSSRAADTAHRDPVAERSAVPEPEQDLWPAERTELMRRFATQSAWPLAALVMLVLLVVFVVVPSAPDHPNEPGAVGTSGVAEAVETAPAAQPDPEPEMVTLEIHPSDVIWISATADGERVLYRLVQQGERVTVEGRRELSFRVGDAAAFEYTINGLPGKPVGGPGAVAEFRITRENHRTFQR